MNVNEGKEKFISTWADMADSWGIPRSLAQVHALLLLTKKEKCADEIIAELGISRGSVHNSVKELLDWGLIFETKREGDHKTTYFVAEKDMWEVFRKILVRRKKRELDPVVAALDELCSVESSCSESECFCQVRDDLRAISNKVNATLEMLSRQDSQWFLKVLMRL